MAKSVKSESQIAAARCLQNTPWCEEYELMISGMLFNSFVPRLANARFDARKWQHDYNTSFPRDARDADSLQQCRLQDLKSIIGHLGGEDIYVEPPFHFDYGCNMSIGDRFYSNFGLTVIDGALVTIGDRVMLGPNVSIFTASHETEVQSRRDNIEYNLPVTIGNDSWIGGHVVILPGVTIGEGCTIGASSVVSRDIPPWSVAIGSPARVVKKVEALVPFSQGS